MKISLFFIFFSSLKGIFQLVKACLHSKGLRLLMKMDKNSSKQLSSMNHSFVCIDISLLKNKFRHNLQDIFSKLCNCLFVCVVCVLILNCQGHDMELMRFGMEKVGDLGAVLS